MGRRWNLKIKVITILIKLFYPTYRSFAQHLSVTAQAPIAVFSFSRVVINSIEKFNDYLDIAYLLWL